MARISIYLMLLLKTLCIAKSNNEFDMSWMPCHQFYWVHLATNQNLILLDAFIMLG